MTNLPRNGVNEERAAIIKLARNMGIQYVPIATYFEINQGRIADVMMGRLYPEVTPANALPTDFPSLWITLQHVMSAEAVLPPLQLTVFQILPSFIPSSLITLLCRA